MENMLLWWTELSGLNLSSWNLLVVGVEHWTYGAVSGGWHRWTQIPSFLKSRFTPDAASEVMVMYLEVK